ncbi:MAG: hypothetical protein GF313_10725 [Caldithrix sp.]|nr:hypothetical protein [Caldithrix sp.]
MSSRIPFCRSFKHLNLHHPRFVFILLSIVLFSSSYSQAPSGNPATVSLQGPDGRYTIFKVAEDNDGDGIDNELEINGFTYNITDGIEPWDGDSSQTYYITDPNRWSTDGDPYSDYMEVTGINMPSAIAPPENHPLVAARPVITIKMTDYDVIPLATITNTKGGEQKNSFTNEVSNSNTVSASVSVGAALNPFKLVSAEVTASYSHTWTNTQSTTSEFGSNWSNTRTTQPEQAAKLKLRIFMENIGGATALDVQPTVNLKLGDKVISTFIPDQQANILTPPGTADNRFPKSDVIAVDKDESNNDIILTLNELRAIQMGTPLSLEVIQVSAKVVRWNANDQDWNSDINWASFESEIDPVSVEIWAEMGDGRNDRFQVFAGTPYWDPQFTFKDIVSLIYEVEDNENGMFIEDRKYPDEWYVSSPSPATLDEWEAAGRPQSLADLKMYRNTKLVMMSPGADPNPVVNLAAYSADYKNVLISAQPNNFPILNVEAEIPINGQMQTFTLTQGQNSFYSMDTVLTAIPDGPGQATVTNARGDETTAPILLPAIYANAVDVKNYSSFIPNPGGDFWIYQNGDEGKPMLLYCQFYDPESGTELEQPREYLTLPSGEAPKVYSDYNAYDDQYRFYFDKVRIDPALLQIDLTDVMIAGTETVVGSGDPPAYLYGDAAPGRVIWSYPEIDSAEAHIDLSGTPFNFAENVYFVQSYDETVFIDRARKVFDVKRKNLMNYSNEYYGFGGLKQDKVQLKYGYDPIQAAQGMVDEGHAVRLNDAESDGYVNMWGDESLRLNGNFTLEAWIYPTGPGTDDIWGGIILNREGEYEIARLQDGSIHWAVKTTTPGWLWQNTGFYAPESQWLHIGLVYDQTEMKVYFNGQLFCIQEAMGSLGDEHPDLNHLRIGNRQSGGTQGFQGVIDEVRIWNRVRSASEMHRTFNDTLNAAYYSTSDSGLIGYWRFNRAEDTGEGVLVSKDLSVNGNDGWLYGDAQLSGLPTDLDDEKPDLPVTYTLSQNFPNPFNPVTTIQYRITRPAWVELSIYNTVGQKIRSLVQEHHIPGNYTLQWDGKNNLGQPVASGLYVYRLSLDGRPIQSRKMVLIR